MNGVVKLLMLIVRGEGKWWVLRRYHEFTGVYSKDDFEV